MEVKRQLHKNNLVISIRDSENFITKSLEALTRIRSSVMGTEYIQNQINKIKASVEDKKKFLENKQKELSLIEDGALDNVIIAEYKK